MRHFTSVRAASLMFVMCACSAAPRLEPSGVFDGSTLFIDTDGGADAGEVVCDTIDFAAPTSVSAQYLLFFSGGVAVADLQKGSDAVHVEFRFKGLNENATFPWPVMLWPSHRAECDTCVSMRRGPRTLFAVGGAMNFAEATRNSMKGRFAGVAPMVRLLEWSAIDDEPVRGGSCVELTNLAFDAAWDTADAGP